MRFETFASRPSADQGAEDRAAERDLVDERRCRRVQQRTRVGSRVREADAVIADRREGQGLGHADRGKDESAEQGAEPIARPQEQVHLRSGADVQHCDDDPEPEAVPRQAPPNAWPLPIACRLVVLGYPEALRVEAEHRQQQRQPDHDQAPRDVEQTLHAP